MTSQKTSENEWTISQAMALVAHRWPIIVLFGLIGALSGWLLAQIWPSPYRASHELYVGLNIYQIAGDQSVSGALPSTFTNADDYKNWQMANLNDLVALEPILEKALVGLQGSDSRWQEVSTAEFNEITHVYWRNAGKWRLVAEHQDPVMAEQAVTAWQDVLVEQVHFSTHSAREAMLIDLQIRTLANQHAQKTTKIATLKFLRGILLTSLEQVTALPGTTIPAPQDLPSMEAIQSMDLGTVWETPVQRFPDVGQPAEIYIIWLEEAIDIANQQLLIFEIQNAALMEEHLRLTERYDQAVQDSMGLSPNLVVEKEDSDPPSIDIVRPIGRFVLIGAILGLIFWGIYWTARVTMASNHTLQ